LFLWFGTDHEVAYRNENILQCAPFALLLTWLGIAIARGRPRGAARAYRVAFSGLACSLLGLVLKVLPWVIQHNGHLIAFFLPLWSGMTLAARLAMQGARE
jgi:hypothetical protein